MRRWLYLLLAWAVIYFISRINTPSRRKRSPRLKSFNQTLNVVVWVILAAYLVGFVYWLAGGAHI